MERAVVEAVAPALRGDVAGSRAGLEQLGVSDPLAWAVWSFGAADYDAGRRLAREAPPEKDPERAVLRDVLRTFVRVEVDGRIVVPVDETAVPATSPVAGLVGFLVTESAYSVGLVERAEAASRRVIERVPSSDPFLPWVRLTRTRVLAFLGRADDAEIENEQSRAEVAGWPLGAALLASHEALIASVRGDVTAIEEAAGRARDAVTFPLDGIGAMAIGLTGLALSTASRPDLALEAVLATGPRLELLPPVSRAHAGDLGIDSCLRLGRIEEARERLAASESLDMEAGSFGAAAVERSRARLRALDHEGHPDAGPHAEMYLTRDRALADIAALPTAPADLEELTRLVAGAGLAAVRSWAGREPGNEESSHRLFAGLGWETLPPQARVVARLAAAGLRNREIGATLFLSERTVESHVATVLAALGTDRRVGIGQRVTARSAPGAEAALTDRQLQVAGLVAEGLPNRQIAERLGITEKTVEKHLAQTFRALGVSSRAALAAAMRAR